MAETTAPQNTHAQMSQVHIDHNSCTLEFAAVGKLDEDPWTELTGKPYTCTEYRISHLKFPIS